MPPEYRSISFRRELTGALIDFLRDEGMACQDTAESLVELVVALSMYQAEGEPLYPQVFVADDLDGMVRLLQAREVIPIGEGPRSGATLRHALKLCAPLAHGGWAVYVQRAPGRFSYGVFRVASLPLSVDPTDS